MLGKDYYYQTLLIHSFVHLVCVGGGGVGAWTHVFEHHDMGMKFKSSFLEPVFSSVM